MLRRLSRLIVGLLCIPFLPILIPVSFFTWVVFDTFLLLRIMDYSIIGKELTFNEYE
jgi:hypothetical protein